MDKTLLLLTVGPMAFNAYREYRARKAGKAQGAAQAPPSLYARLPAASPAQLDRLTERFGPVRLFRKTLAPKLYEALGELSAVPVDLPELRGLGRAWEIVPQTPGAQRAADVLGQAWRSPGAIVLGSLSLSLPLYSAAPKLLFACDHKVAERLAPVAGGSPLAVIPPPSALREEPVATPPVVAPPPSESTPVVAKANGSTNGAARVATPKPSEAAGAAEVKA